MVENWPKTGMWFHDGGEMTGTHEVAVANGHKAPDWLVQQQVSTADPHHPPPPPPPPFLLLLLSLSSLFEFA